MKALVALPVRSTDYWHEDAVVVHCDAEMRELVDAIGSNRVMDLIDVSGWPSHPEQPVLLMWEVSSLFDTSRLTEFGDLMPGWCSPLSADQWAAVADGRVEEVFNGG